MMKQISILEELQLFLEAEGEADITTADAAIESDMENPKTPQLKLDVNPNPTKKGIKVKFFPVNEQGMVLNNLTPEEIDTLQNSIATTVSKRAVHLDTFS